MNTESRTEKRRNGVLSDIKEQEKGAEYDLDELTMIQIQVRGSRRRRLRG